MFGWSEWDRAPAEHTVVGINDLNNPNTGHGNTLSSNDIGIAVLGNQEPGPCTDVNPAYEVNSNTVSSGNEAGIALKNLGYGGATLASPLQANSVSGITEGVGIEMLKATPGKTSVALWRLRATPRPGAGSGLSLARVCLRDRRDLRGFQQWAGAE